MTSSSVNKLNGSNGYLSGSSKVLSNNQQQTGSSYLNYNSKPPSHILKTTPSSSTQKKISHNGQVSYKKSNNNSKENLKYDHLPDI